jgi:glycosyltransferase involved in cell wall biosynthesis
MASPKISVVVPVYNSARFLSQTIGSLVNQTENKRNWDVTFVDDGSVDNSREVLADETRRLPNAKVVYNNKNMGISYTRNRGVQASDGKLIAVLDHDDTYPDHALEASLQFLGKNPDTKYMYSAMNQVDPSGKLLHVKESLPFSYDDLFHYNFVSHLRVFSRDLHEAIGGYDPKIVFPEDWDHSLRAAIHLGGKGFKNNPKALYNYCVREGVSLSTKVRNDAKLWIAKLIGRMVEKRTGKKVRAFWKEKVQRPGNNEFNYYDWEDAA